MAGAVRKLMEKGAVIFFGMFIAEKLRNTNDVMRRGIGCSDPSNLDACDLPPKN